MIADIVNSGIQAKAKTAARILVLDIETSPTLTYTFGMRPKWISPEKIVEPSRMLCFGAKWIGGKRTTFKSEHHHGREAMLDQLWSMLDKAEAVIGYNTRRFDLKHIAREFAFIGRPPPSPHKDIDLYAVVGSRFDIESKSLNHVAQRLGVGEKVQHSGFDLWRRCLAGEHAAWEEMKEYQLGDVDVTEAVYWALLPYITTHPQVYVTNNERPTCDRCPDGGDLGKPVGEYLANQLVYPRYRCKSCGTNLRGLTHMARRNNTRAIR